MDRSRLLAPLALALFCACWGGKFVDMPGRVERMEAGQADLQAGVDSLRAKAATAETLLRSLQAQSGSRTAELVEQLSALTDEMEQLLRRMGGGTQARPSAADTAVSAGARVIYDEAYQQYQQRDYGTASMGFLEVFEDPGSGSLADDALYFAALCHEALGQAHKAIEELVALRLMFPESERAPAALSRAAAIYAAHGAGADRDRILQELIEDYPGSEEAGLARVSLGVR